MNLRISFQVGFCSNTHFPHAFRPASLLKRFPTATFCNFISGLWLYILITPGLEAGIWRLD
jgi:hypothetical protein